MSNKMYPSYFIFNPTCEMAIANEGIAFHPNKMLHQFELDLEFLPILFAKKGDYIAVSQPPSEELSDFFNEINLRPVKYLNRTNHNEILSDKNISLNTLQPWGWSPSMHHFLEPLKKHCSGEFHKRPNSNWTTEHKNLYSRETSLNILKNICFYKNDFMLPAQFHPRKVSTLNEVELAFQDWGQVVLKAPWSSSGRGIQMLRYGYLNESNKQWITGIIRQQGCIMVEPLLNKKLDFAMQLHISYTNIEFCGLSVFNTNTNGQYEQNLLNQSQLVLNSITAETFENIKLHLINSMQELGIPNLYHGFAGVDMMLIEIENKQYIQPCVEVNWRYNMGILGIYLEQIIQENSTGSFNIFFAPGKKFEDFHIKMKEKHPLSMTNGKIIKGYFPLSDPQRAVSGAYVLVEKAK